MATVLSQRASLVLLRLIGPCRLRNTLAMPKSGLFCQRRRPPRSFLAFRSNNTPSSLTIAHHFVETSRCASHCQTTPRDTYSLPRIGRSHSFLARCAPTSSDSEASPAPLGAPSADFQEGPACLAVTMAEAYTPPALRLAGGHP
jgi:hypothetical protein